MSSPELVFVKQDKIFECGETVKGFLKVAASEITGFSISLETVCSFTEMNCVGGKTKQYFPCNSNQTTNDRIKFGFSFVIPEDCPLTFKGRKGHVKNKLNVEIKTPTEKNCGNNKLTAELTIIARRMPEWEAHALCVSKTRTRKGTNTITPKPHMNITMETDQKCYEPGGTINFTLTVENRSSYNVRPMSLQFRQYAWCEPRLNEIQVVSERIVGPRVQKKSTHIWSGIMAVPIHLQPSHPTRIRHNRISYFYALVLELDFTGCSNNDRLDHFPIDIGCMLIHSSGSDKPELPVTESNEGSNLLGLPRRMSVLSITPSLPDYETAISSLCALPPSYSRLDLS